jgi:hypothetical protein
MKWFEQLVGSKGSSRAFILTRLQKPLLIQTTETDEARPLGLLTTELVQISDQHYFKQLTSDFSSRGDEERIKEIAWFGSVIGDIFCPVQFGNKDAILKEAAIFNVAIAFFDTVVDDLGEDQLKMLANAVTPYHMFQRIKNPRGMDYALQSEDQSLDRILKLFDFVLVGIGNRFNNDRIRRDHLFELLAVMYKSEITSVGNKIKAKRLPIVFMGLLSGQTLNPKADLLLNELGRLLSLLDDWQDLGMDILNGKANGFVYHREGRGFFILPYRLFALFRIAGFYLSYLSIAWVLSRSLAKVMTLAEQAGPEFNVKTNRLLRSLLIPS